MFSRSFRLFATFACLAMMAGAAHAARTLDAQAEDGCAPWDGLAVRVTAPLPDGRLLVAAIWAPDRLTPGLELEKQAMASASGPGNAMICPDAEHTTGNDCEPVGIRINISDAKDGDTGTGTLYIEDMGSFILNVRWTHTPRFCG